MGKSLVLVLSAVTISRECCEQLLLLALALDRLASREWDERPTLHAQRNQPCGRHVGGNKEKALVVGSGQTNKEDSEAESLRWAD